MASGQTEQSAPPQPLVCEISWEVCQQVGGIYTVIRSKAPEMVERLGERYLLVGPYNPDVSSVEFEEMPPEGFAASAIQVLRDEGLGVHYGRWLVSGEPRVVLLDYRSAWGKLGEIKYLLWHDHQIPTPPADGLIDAVVTFGWMVQRFLQALAWEPERTAPLIAHFHEWMSGSAIPGLRRVNAPLAIVFTTHATMLGRYLAMNDPWFYDHVPFVNWEADAKRFNIDSQVRIERAAAHGAHVFTTVSDVTAYECEHLIGRWPEVLLPNGLNIERFVAMHEFQNLHREYKERIHQFVMGHFFPSYTFDLDQTLFFFSSGRYEYRNKGFDITIDALAALNARMQRETPDKTVVFFLTTRRPYRSINAEALQSRAQLEEMRRTCMEIRREAGERLFMETARGHNPRRLEDLVDPYWLLRLTRMRHGWRISRLPAIVTHDLVDDAGDEVLNAFRRHNLINWPGDRVKVVYFADFLTPLDPLMGLEYDQFVRGCHLGIFPSYYEPWGYTPQECMARGVPSVSSDLAGFGAYVQRHLPNHADKGVYVLRRRYASYSAAVGELTDMMFRFVSTDRRARIALRNATESSAERFDWSQLVDNYYRAYTLAVQRIA